MTSGGDKYFVIDVERSTNAAIENGYNVGEGKNFSYKEWSGLVLCDRAIRDEEAVSFEPKLHNCAELRLEIGEALLVDKRVVGDDKVQKFLRSEKPKKKGCAKPPKPPRPPCSLTLDLADQKLIKEISDLMMLKKARADRVKALKKIKNGKSASSSAGNTFALVISIIFCIVIFWQGVFSNGSSNSAFLGSPQSSIGTATNSNNSSSIISFQFFRNASNGWSS
ncbi:uncharacterized protein LOC110036563 isoform X2 [Phalaenopsis equestris]|nr:uncharacterized protein LOC110036563 isoform X2 [Phalaenopsis equestris]XP_020596695.1 uncharacterized protein LOC110036563 isoform X2 [Phalaenopsis equestris]